MLALRTAAVALGFGLATASLAAAPAAPAPILGTVISVAGGSLQLRTAEMQQVTVILGPQTRVVETVAIRMADVKSGDFLGTTAAPQNGRLVASEVHVFDEAMRGTGEGHYPWTQPGSTMTNGAATMTNGAATRAADGVTMTVTYKGGQQQVTVPPGVPVTRVKIVESSRLAAGQRVTVFGTARDEKTVEANLVSLAPPAN
jgi:hypothetical protein